MTTANISYRASASITISPASLASSSTFTAGRSSAVVDNTTNKDVDALVGGTLRVGTSPTSGSQIRVYAWRIRDDTPTYPDVIDGTDSAKTLTSAGVADAWIRLAAVINVDSATTGRDYPFEFELATLFGGIMPSKWGLFITHNTAVALDATAGNFAAKYTGVTYTFA